MAWQDLYIIGGSGDDLAGGSGTGAVTASDTAGSGTVLQGGGAGGGTSDKFTGSSGTPFSATQVGDYISIYTGTPTATSYVAKVTAVNASGASVDYDSTTGYGTRPANGATYKAKTGGCWNSFSPLNNFSTATNPQSTRVNVKGWTGAAQITYSPSGSISVQLTGATTKPFWLRGYKTSPGDLDNGSTTATDYPLVSMGTNLFTVGTAFSLISGLSFTGARTTGPVYQGSGNGAQVCQHCRFANTSSNSAAESMRVNVSGLCFLNCYFTTPSTANQIVGHYNTGFYQGCYFDGAGSGSTQVGALATTGGTFIDCTFSRTGSHGINCSSNNTPLVVIGCTFKSCAGDSIRFTTNLPNISGISIIANNVFASSGGFDINNSTGTNTAVPGLANNLSYSPTSGHLNGFGDWAELNALTDGSSPFVSSSDLHLVSGSAGAGAGLPGQWENVTGIAYPDVGAWQRQVTNPPVGQIAGARSIGTY